MIVPIASVISEKIFEARYEFILDKSHFNSENPKNQFKESEGNLLLILIYV